MGAKYLTLDITNSADFDQLPKEGVDGVILLAGLLPANVHDESGDEHAAAYFEVNVIGTINVLEYCRKNGIRKVIGFSSYSDVAKAWKNLVRIKAAKSFTVLKRRTIRRFSCSAWKKRRTTSDLFRNTLRMKNDAGLQGGNGKRPLENACFPQRSAACGIIVFC